MRAITRRKKIYIAVILVALAIGLYFSWPRPPVPPQGQELLQSVVQMPFNKISSVKVGGVVKSTFETGSGKVKLESDISLNYGKYNDYKISKIDFNADVKYTAEGKDGTFKLKSILDDKALYLQVLPTEDLPKALSALSPYVNSWVKITPKDLAKDNMHLPSYLMGLTMLSGDDNLIVVIKRDLIDKGILVERNPKGGGQVGSEYAWKIGIEVNGENILKYFSDLSNVDNNFSKEVQSDARAYYATIGVKDYEVNLWQSRRNSLPAKLEFNVDFAGGEGSAEGELAFDDYNGLLRIEPPATSTSFSDLRR